METIKLGNTDMRIPKLGMGTWAIGGGPAWGDNKNVLPLFKRQ